MSERGSFTTEFIYCYECFEAATTVLVRDEKYLRGVVIPSWQSFAESPERGAIYDSAAEEWRAALPIIAGKIGASWAGGELSTMDLEIGPALAAVICHPMRIAVLAEDGERIFTIEPDRLSEPRGPSGDQNPPATEGPKSPDS